MPTIHQLPEATNISAADELPLSQNGVTRAATVGELLSGVQPAILTPQSTLLGRISVGAGGPETVSVGTGLTLAGGEIAANGQDHAGFAPKLTLNPSDEVVINSGALPCRMPLALLRGLFSGGTNVSIDGNGVISAPSGASVAPASIAQLPTASTIAATDLVAISQNGIDHAIQYSSFLEGQTIDLAAPARAASDTDNFWVAQGSSTMVRQTLSALWNWIAAKLATYKKPVVELAADTTLDGTVHNGCVLVCSQPLKLTPAFANMGSGFTCDVINLSGGAVEFGTGIISSSGANVLPNGQCTSIWAIAFSGGNLVFSALTGGAPASSPAQSPSAPGQVSTLTAASPTSTAIPLTWTAPASGGAVTNYTVQYRVAGQTTWLTASNAVGGTSYSVTGLSPSTAYELQVFATNSAGSGPASAMITAQTAAVVSATVITPNLMPSSAAHGSSPGVNVHVNPTPTSVQAAFSSSSSEIPSEGWNAGANFSGDLWAWYLPAPASPGTAYVWVQALDASGKVLATYTSPAWTIT